MFTSQHGPDKRQRQTSCSQTTTILSGFGLRARALPFTLLIPSVRDAGPWNLNGDNEHICKNITHPSSMVMGADRRNRTWRVLLFRSALCLGFGRSHCYHSAEAPSGPEGVLEGQGSPCRRQPRAQGGLGNQPGSQAPRPSGLDEGEVEHDIANVNVEIRESVVTHVRSRSQR